MGRLFLAIMVAALLLLAVALAIAMTKALAPRNEPFRVRPRRRTHPSQLFQAPHRCTVRPALNEPGVNSLADVTARLEASTGDENACLRSRLRKPGSSSMQHDYKRAKPLDLRLTNESQRLRKEARGTPPGIERERLLRRARRSETAAQMQGWFKSPGSKSST
jgi:hypothetical protein